MYGVKRMIRVSFSKLALISVFILCAAGIALILYKINNDKGDNVMAEQMLTKPIIEQRADPWVYKHTDGFYYFTASVPEYDRIEIRRSKTIEGLADSQPAIVWRKHDSGIMSKHIWAPEIHNINGKWYIYFAAGEAEDVWKIRPYVLECTGSDVMTDEWAEKGKIQSEVDITAFTDFSLDATPFEHKGKGYLIWAEKRNNISNLYIAEMSNPWTIATKAVMITTPAYKWEQVGFHVNEGPAVLKRNGKIFVSYSASATDSNYCLGLLAAEQDSDLLEAASWRKAPEPVFGTNPETGRYGPGHNSFTVSEDGTRDILIYHARTYKEIEGDPLYDPNRHTFSQELKWNKDGTPDFGIPGEN